MWRSRGPGRRGWRRRGRPRHYLGVLDLLPAGQPGRGGAGQRRHDPQPRGRQPEHSVESGQVLPDVGNRGRGCRRRAGLLQQHHGLTAAVYPVNQQGLDAVGHVELARGVAARRREQAVGGGLAGRMGAGGRGGWGQPARRGEHPGRGHSRANNGQPYETRTCRPGAEGKPDHAKLLIAWGPVSGRGARPARWPASYGAFGGGGLRRATGQTAGGPAEPRSTRPLRSQV